MNFMSLFAGIGGFDLGFETAGMTCVAQCEIDPWCQKILNKHWPDVPVYSDIKTLTSEQLKDDGIETIDLICGGFPCQPFSLAGNRNGTEDDRHLWPEMLRIIEETRPTWVIGENVAGIISMEQFALLSKMEGQANRVSGAYDDFEAVYLRKADMLLNSIIEDLEKIGYSVQSFVIPAVAVDAKHRRDRIWIVGYAEHNGLSTTEIAGSLNKAGDNVKKRAHKAIKSKGAGESRGCEDVANTCRKGLPESARRLFKRIQRQIEAIEGRPIDGRITAKRRTWPAEPPVGRVADGVSRRVDRLKGLGNAVVPQIPEIIGRFILEIEHGHLQ